MTTRPSFADAVRAVRPTQSANRTLQEIMEIESWEGNKPAVIHQAVWRGLIKRLAQLEEDKIFYGELDASKISIYQESKVTINNEPPENDFNKQTFREQIKPLITKAFQVQALSENLECGDFLRQIQNDDIPLGRLESHPFLQSYEKKAYFLLEAVNKLKTKYGGNWQSVYNDEVKDYTSIRKVVCGKKGYSDVFDYETYEDNAAGALWYSRNVVAHIGKYFKEDETPPSKEEVGKMLSEFFPKMMLRLHNFMVKNGIDTGSEPRYRLLL